MCAKEGFLLVESLTDDENSGDLNGCPPKMFLLGKAPPKAVLDQEKDLFVCSNLQFVAIF